MKSSAILAGLLVGSVIPAASGYAFVVRSTSHPTVAGSRRPTSSQVHPTTTQLQMVDQQVLMGGAVVLLGLGAGIGLVAFTENQGERARERGGGLSEAMSTRIAGALLEDVEVSSVNDLGSLTSQLEKALQEAGGQDAKEFEMTEEEKKKIADAADDGW